MKTPSILFTYLALLSVLFFSCHSTENKTGTLSGTVTLLNDSSIPANDPVDFSGVTIALYELVRLDTTLVRINNEYPQIGFQISQETEFDHRNSQPLKSVTSDANGAFSIKGIDLGKYIVVLLKEQWGLKYYFNIEITANEDTNLGNLELYPVTSFSSSVAGDKTLKSDHTYTIQGDVNFVGSVTIEPRAMIYGSPGSIIKFTNNLVTPISADMTNAWRLMSSKNLYLTQQSEIDVVDNVSSIQIYGEQVNLSSGIIRYINNSIVLYSGNCDVSYLRISHCGTGLYLPQSNAAINNIIVSNGNDPQTSNSVRVLSSSAEQILISDSIFMAMYEAVIINAAASYNVSNNYFWNSYRAITTTYCSGVITHNSFDLNQFDIHLQYSTSPTEIAYNNFFKSTRTCIRPIGNVIVSNNNFFKTNEFFINIRSSDLAHNSTVPADMNATNNYWAVSIVDDYLLDATDNIIYPDSPCDFYVLYLPKRGSVISNAGIQ